MLDATSSLTKRIRKLRRVAKADKPAPLVKGEGFQPDGSFLSLHPTKGFRRIGPKRLAAYSSN